MQIGPILLALMWTVPVIAICQSVPDDALAARTAFAAHKYSQAAKLYEEALANHPHFPELQSELGLAYQMEGDHLGAIRSYLAALRLEDLPHTRELLAIERCRLRQYQAVTPLLAQIAHHLSKDDPLLPVLSPCYLETEAALDALRVAQTLELSSTVPPDQVLIYRSHASMKASNFFIGQLRKTPDGAPYIQYLNAARDSGSADARSGFPSALAHSSYLRSDLTLNEGLALFPHHSADSALLYMLSVLSGEQGMQSIVECQQKYPDSPWLAQFQAQMFTAQGQYQEAKEIYTQLLASHPELPDLRHDAAMLYRSQREWEQALALFRAGLAADPTDDRAVVGISESLIQLGNYTEAAAFLAPRFSTSPAPLWAALDLSQAYQRLEKYPEAIGVLTRAEQSFPQAKQIHFRLMRLYALTGQTDLAQKENALFARATHP